MTVKRPWSTLGRLRRYNFVKLHYITLKAVLNRCVLVHFEAGERWSWSYVNRQRVTDFRSTWRETTSTYYRTVFQCIRQQIFPNAYDILTQKSPYHSLYCTPSVGRSVRLICPDCSSTFERHIYGLRFYSSRVLVEKWLYMTYKGRTQRRRIIVVVLGDLNVDPKRVHGFERSKFIVIYNMRIIIFSVCNSKLNSRKEGHEVEVFLILRFLCQA